MGYGFGRSGTDRLGAAAVAIPPTVTLSNVLNVAKVNPYPVLLDSLATPKYEHILRANFSARIGEAIQQFPLQSRRAGVLDLTPQLR